MSNVIQISDLRAKKDKSNKIDQLKLDVKEFNKLITLKKNYLIGLRKFDKYATIKTECEKVYNSILDYERQVRNLKDQIDNLSQGKA